MPDAPPSDAARDAGLGARGPAGGAVPAPPAGTTLIRAAPGILLIALVSLAPLWGVLAQGWSVLAVVFVYVADGIADGLTFWLRARRAQGAASDEDAKDRVLVSEFVRTYFVVVGAMALVLYMVFGGRLLKPGGGVPEGVFRPFTTWQFWAVVAGFVAVRWFTLLVGLGARRGGGVHAAGRASCPRRCAASSCCSSACSSVGSSSTGRCSSSPAALVVLVLVVAAAEVALAVLERLRTARVRAAVEAGVRAEPRGARRDGPAARPPKARPRGGRRRARRR